MVEVLIAGAEEDTIRRRQASFSPARPCRPGRMSAASAQASSTPGRSGRWGTAPGRSSRLYTLPVRFEWDAGKASHNLAKHGVPFEEATSVFSDGFFLTVADPDHSLAESRYIIMGQSTQGRLLVVSYTERPPAVRLISAREATRRERQVYEKGF
jgi:uncharacterized protein